MDMMESPDASFNKRFIIYKKIGKGSFGKVYSGYDTAQNKLVAIKIEIQSKSRILFEEARVLSDLKFIKGFPNIYLCTKLVKNLVLVQDLLGPNLENLKQKQVKKHFSPETCLVIA